MSPWTNINSCQNSSPCKFKVPAVALLHAHSMKNLRGSGAEYKTCNANEKLDDFESSPNMIFSGYQCIQGMIVCFLL